MLTKKYYLFNLPEKMKLLAITTVSTVDHSGFNKLATSFEMLNYDCLAICHPNINWNWSGLPFIYDWCKEQIGYTHFMYTDGFDTLALGGMEEIYSRYYDTEKMLFSGEKACFPRSDWADKHKSDSRWRYLNHGQFISPINVFLDMYDGVFDFPITCQEFAMEKFLAGDERIKIDTNCDIFQSIAFKGDDEFCVKGGRLINNITNTIPILVHGNGRSDMNWVYDISKND